MTPAARMLCTVVGPRSPMPNALAYVMLLVWPVIAVAIYRKLPPMQATVWAILGAYMLLPAGTGDLRPSRQCRTSTSSRSRRCARWSARSGC